MCVLQICICTQDLKIIIIADGILNLECGCKRQCKYHQMFIICMSKQKKKKIKYT